MNRLRNLLAWIDYILVSDFKLYPDDRFRCERAARITYYSSYTRPQSRQRGH